MARVVVAGYIVRYPLAGNVWAHFQYVLGLERLGHEVWFVEDAGWEESCYDPERNVMTSDPSSGLRTLDALAERFDLDGRWAYRDGRGDYHGLDGTAVDEAIAAADLFLDVGGVSHFPQMREAGRRAYVDMDPVFTQLGAFGHSRLDAYDTLFTYGANIGRGASGIPDDGLRWRPLRPPVVLDLWADGRAPELRDRWTTVAAWTAYGAVERDGVTYGQKDVEFERIMELPAGTAQELELAVSGPDVPRARLEAAGWRLADPRAVSRDPWTYREYVWGSRGEFSVAKNAYVKTRSGWFSDRTATYLASGRPAVVQDTGLDAGLARGEGLLTFTTVEEAAEALARVEAGYAEHARAARELAEAHLDSDLVLTRLLDEADA